MNIKHKMTKSPLALARDALLTTQAVLPGCSSKYSRHNYTQAQLLPILVLRQSFLTNGAYDGEHNHCLCREELGIRLIGIPGTSATAENGSRLDTVPR